jgi:hypothetical protein
MCHPVPCEVCGKVTWAGCGLHIEEVRAMVRPEDWCPGHDGDQAAADAAGRVTRALTS